MSTKLGIQTILPLSDGTFCSRFFPIQLLTTITKSTADQSARGKLNSSYLCNLVTIIFSFLNLETSANVSSANSTNIISVPLDEKNVLIFLEVSLIGNVKKSKALLGGGVNGIELQLS